jgi:hypothetical protein
MALSDINAAGSSDTSSVPQSQLYGSSNSTYGLPTTIGGSGGSAVANPTATAPGTNPQTVNPATIVYQPQNSEEQLPSYDSMATATQGMNPLQDLSGLDASSGLDTNINLPSDTGTGTSAASAASSGLDWSSILSGLGQIASSPLGSSAALIGLGEYEASQAQSQTAALTAQLSGPGNTFIGAGTTELGQTMQGLTGAPVSGNSSIAQQEQAASELGTVANQYSTGQLTSAQQTQLTQQNQAAKQNIRAQLESQGITDASVIAGYDQQIDSQTAITQQQLIQGNLQIGQTALSSVQNTYSTLLTQSIGSLGAGMGPLEDAINLTVQQNTNLANGLQTLFGQIARGFSGASGSGTTGSSGNTVAGGVNTIASALKSFLNGGSSNTIGSQYAQPGGSELPGATSGDLTDASSEITDPTGGINFADDATDLTDASDAASDASDISDLSSFSSAGGQAAGTELAGGIEDVTTDASAGIASDVAATDVGSGAAAGAAAGLSVAGLGAGVGAFLSPLLVPEATNAANDPQLESQLAQGNASTFFGTQTGMQSDITNVSGQGYVDPNAPNASQTYQFLPSGYSGYYGYVGGATPQNPNAAGAWYLPGSGGTVVADQSQYDQISTMIGQAQQITAGSSGAVDAGGSFTAPSQAALEQVGFFDLLDSLPKYTGSGSPFGPGAGSGPSLTPAQLTAVQQGTVAQSYGQITGAYASGGGMM